MLGIIIGVSAVHRHDRRWFRGQGANSRNRSPAWGRTFLIILSGSSTSGGMRWGSGTVPTLTVDDAKAILSEVPASSMWRPTFQESPQVVYGNQNWSTNVNGTTPGGPRHPGVAGRLGPALYAAGCGWGDEGVPPGKTVVDNLFGGIDPIGQIIRIKKVPSPWSASWGPKVRQPLDRSGRHNFCSSDHRLKEALRDAVSRMVRVIAVQAKDRN